jgi:hypothetical protein
MTTYVLLTEDELDAKLMEALLERKNVHDVKYIAAGGWSGADSLARSYLTDPHANVALVVDSDSLDEGTTEERKRFLRRSLGQIADTSRWRVVVIKPEIDVLLFEDLSVLQGLVGHKVDSHAVTDVHFSVPSDVFASMLGETSIREVYERLRSVDLLPILDKHPEIAELAGFFRPQKKKAIATHVHTRNR